MEFKENQKIVDALLEVYHEAGFTKVTDTEYITQFNGSTLRLKIDNDQLIFKVEPAGHQTMELVAPFNLDAIYSKYLAEDKKDITETARLLLRKSMRFFSDRITEAIFKI